MPLWFQSADHEHVGSHNTSCITQKDWEIRAATDSKLREATERFLRWRGWMASGQWSKDDVMREVNTLAEDYHTITGMELAEYL